MGLFDLLFRHPRAGASGGVWKSLTAYQPAFTNWGGELYESELVRSAIDAKARHVSKLSVTVRGTARPKLQTKLRRAPNDWQTWGQFLYRLSTILDMQNTAVIVPVFDEYGDPAGVFPILPSRCEMVDVNGTPWLRYTFSDGKKAALPLSSCGLMVQKQYKDDYFGESNTALRDTMHLIDIQNQGVTEAVKNSNTFRFMARVSNFSKPDDLSKERQRFNRENFQNDGGGILLFPNTYTDIKQCESKPFVVDAAQLGMIRTNVYNYFGVNEDVLQNKTIGNSWAAFYEGAVEPFAIQLADVLTKMIFSERERANGSAFYVSANRLQYMSNEDKLNVSAQMADRGLMTRNEIREIWNLPPLPDEIGDQLPVRGEYYNLGERGENDEKPRDAGDGTSDSAE